MDANDEKLAGNVASRSVASVTQSAQKPYTARNVPDYVPANAGSQWAATWNAVFEETGDEEKAFAIANGTYGPNAKNAMRSEPMKSMNLAASLIHKAGKSIIAPAQKSLSASGNGFIEGYLVSWGSESDTDLQGEYFTPRTDFCLPWFNERPVLYHHGMDDKTALKAIGTIKTIQPDDLGLWVQAQLDMRDRYAAAIYDMVKSKEFGWSSGSVDHLVKISQKGEILQWPIIEGSVTPTPAQPAKTTVRALKSAIIESNDVSAEYVQTLDNMIARAKFYAFAQDRSLGNSSSEGTQVKDVNMRNRRSIKGNETMEIIDPELPESKARRFARRKDATMDNIEPELPGEFVRSRNNGGNMRSRRSSFRSELDGAEHLGEFSVDTPPTEHFSEEAKMRALRRRLALRRAARSESAEESPAAVASRIRARMEARRAARAEVQNAMGSMEGAVEDAATAAYRRGVRSGIRRAQRAEGELETSAPVARRARKDENEEAAAYRRGYYRGLSRAQRNADPNAPVAPAPVAPAVPAVAPAPVAPAAPAAPATPEDQATTAARAYRRGYVAAMRRATRSEEKEEMKNTDIRASRSRAYRSAGNENYWRERAERAERMEAPGERAFKSVSKVRDAADREGNYSRAFKSYIYNGLGLMTETEKYTLRNKGKVDWKNDSGVSRYDAATKSVKTVYGGSDASAGFSVPPDWVSELNKNVMSQTVMAGECRTRTTTSDRIVQPSINTTDARRAHAATLRWPDEVITTPSTETGTEADEYSQVEVPIHLMLIQMAVTNSALEDATFSLEDEITEAFSEAVAVGYDQLIYAGDGQGKLQGIVSNSKVTGAASTGPESVSGYVATGSALGFVNADCLKTMLYHLPQPYQQRAKWFMNANTALAISQLKDGMGNYLIDERNEGLRTVGVPDRLLGKPIVYNVWASNPDANSFPVVLGDLSRGYIIGKRVDFSIRRFDDSRYAEYDQVLFLGRARLGGQVLQPAAIKVLKVAES